VESYENACAIFQKPKLRHFGSIRAYLARYMY